MTTNPTETHDGIDLLATLEITKIEPRGPGVGGAWVTGDIAGHAFEALVFPGHAETPAYELGDSRISKLFLQTHFTHTEVACFDRGWDTKPTTDLARQIVDLLAAGLAELIFHA